MKNWMEMVGWAVVAFYAAVAAADVWWEVPDALDGAALVAIVGYAIAGIVSLVRENRRLRDQLDAARSQAEDVDAALREMRTELDKLQGDGR